MNWKAILVVLVSLCAFALASPIAAADAAVPTHEIGDKVGFGTRIDLGALAQSFLNQIRAVDEQDDNFTIHDLELNGSLDIWATMEVVGKSTDAYTIRTNTANGLKLDYLLNVTSSQLPQAGTYPGNQSFGCFRTDFPTTTVTTSVDVTLEYLATSTGDSKWTVSDFALSEDRTNSSFEFQSTATLRNAPIVNINYTACEVTVAYEDYDLTANATVASDLRRDFAPALDLFDFPIQDNESWSAASTATLGGTIRGTIDVGGLDPEEEQAYFDALHRAFTQAGLTVTGLDAFPIVLEDISVLVGGTAYLEGGVIHDISTAINMSLTAHERRMTLADGERHTVYLVAQDLGGMFPNPCGWVYSPDDRFIVGFLCEYMGISFFELKNVPPATAEQRIAETKQEYGVGTAAIGGPNALGDFFLKPPFTGIVLIAAVAIVAIALLMRRRRKPVMAPPGPPPRMPDEGPSEGPPPTPP